MKQKKTAVLLLCWTHVLLSWGGPHSAQSAESHALASVSFRDGVTLFSPALFSQERSEIRLCYQNLYLCSELQSVHLEGAFHHPRIRWGASFRTFGYTHYRTFTEALSSCIKLSRSTLLGASLHLTTLRYTGMERCSNQLMIDVDLAQSIKGEVTLYSQYAQNFFLSPRTASEFIETDRCHLSVGATLPILHNTHFYLESECYDWQRITLKCAFEHLTNGFAIRLGCKGLPLTPSFGFGYHWKTWQIDVADQWQIHLGHQIAIGIHFQIHQLIRP